MKRLLTVVAILTGALAFQGPVLAQDDVTMQVFEGALNTDPATHPEGSSFGRSVAESATEDGQALGDTVSGNVSEDSGDFARRYHDETREIRERSLNLEIRQRP